MEMMARRGRDSSKNMSECPLERDDGVGMDCGVAGWAGGRKGKRKNLHKCSKIKKNLKNSHLIVAIFKIIDFKSKF